MSSTKTLGNKRSRLSQNPLSESDFRGILIAKRKAPATKNVLRGLARFDPVARFVEWRWPENPKV